jgi:hypothetical protein
MGMGVGWDCVVAGKRGEERRGEDKPCLGNGN